MNPSDQTTSALRLLEHKIPPPILVIMIGLAMWAASRLAPAIANSRDLSLVLAGIFGLLGFSMLGSGFLAFRKAKTTIDPVRIESASSVVTGGIFAYTRNPMYVGFTALLVAWASYLAIPWTLLGPVFFVLFITRFQIIPEERVMSSKFGPAYDEYRKHVRRWL
jgi:protein-S-isoprenylcysteine O-methyltransferase Ste14